MDTLLLQLGLILFLIGLLTRFVVPKLQTREGKPFTLDLHLPIRE